MVSPMEETPKEIASPRVNRSGTVARQNGHAIRALREKEGWTQKGLAEAAGLRQASLSDIEREASSATRRTLNKIARKLGVPVCAIMREPADEANDMAETAAAAA